MTKPKRHHYLPQFYLEYFCKEDGFWVFDREVNEFRQQTPKNTALKSYYYSVQDAEGNKRMDIEYLLSQIEGHSKEVISKLLARKTITPAEREELSIFIGFMMNRVPDFEKSINMVEKHLIQQFADLMFSDEARVQSIMDKQELETGERQTLSAKEIVEFHKNRQYDIVIHRNESLRLMLSLSLDMAKYFRQMNWGVFHASEKTSFITTDNPVVLMPPVDYEYDSSWGVGIITPGAKKLFPLSQTACLIMYDHGDLLVHKDVDPYTVRRINLNVASHADRFVIGRDEALVRNLVKVTKIGHSKRKGRFKIG